MNDRTLVKVTYEEKGLSFRTISKDKKSPHSFYISRGVLDDFYDLTSAVVSVSDCGSFAQIWRDELRETIHIRFSWLRRDGHQLSGWEETVIVPFFDLMEMNKGRMGKKWSLLSLEVRACPQLVFCSKERLHEAISDPLVRRKLVRFLRDNFKWPGADMILLHNDFEPYSFFFREVRGGRYGVSGGLILHGRENLKTANYAIHT